MTFNDIEDLALDSNFNVYIDHTGDLGVVKGRAAFEQKMVIRLTERLRSLIGEPQADKETIRKLAKEYAQRVATEMDQLERVAAFEAEFPDDKLSTLEVTVIYDTGEQLTFEVTS